MDNKSKKEELFLIRKNGYDRINGSDMEALEAYAGDYMIFLDNSKTERECVAESISQAEEYGFEPYSPYMIYSPGDKIYYDYHGKSLILVVFGKKRLDAGLRIVAAHGDSPRLDLKPYPLYEDSEMALLKTHYYGGIKKYQWMTLPLALRGVVYLHDGIKVNISIGDDITDPVLVVTDLLPHLAEDQMKKNVREAFPGENMNVLAGTVPDKEEGTERVKLKIMELLNEKYGIKEEDFQSAELTLVPAGLSREVGLDRSVIGGYGHDDRACAYAGLRALFDSDLPEYTSVCMITDKEEIGSEGITGMQSAFFDDFIEALCESQEVKIRDCYRNSFCLSADVCNAFDPNFADVSDKNNNAKMNYGVGIFKYTGRGGKSGASDASAETMSHLRKILERENVLWQMGELGKVDKGGGGTVSCYMARRGIAVVDAGTPVLSMHAPFELVSKLDAYMTYRACLAVYRDF